MNNNRVFGAFINVNCAFCQTSKIIDAFSNNINHLKRNKVSEEKFEGILSPGVILSKNRKFICKLCLIDLIDELKEE